MKDDLRIIQFNKAEQLWHKFARQAQNNDFTFELEVYKKLLNIFHVGEYYYYIFNLATTQVELVSELVKNVLKMDDIAEFNKAYVLQNIHPDDIPFFVEFENKAGEFLLNLPPGKCSKYKISYDYRLKRKDGEYIRILQQILPIHVNDEGGIVRTLCTHTNIDHIKNSTDMSLSFIGLDGEPSYLNIATSKTENLLAAEKFTKREKAILTLLIEGKNSQDIAEHLHISKFTVDTHRRNMLQKTQLRSIAELTLKYMQGSLM